jgi:hypothetical protein
MLKKILLISLLFIGLLKAATITINKATYTSNENIIASYKNTTNGQRDWIAIYPKNSSNAWANVIQWKWIKGEVNGNTTFTKLPVGEYEVRVFFNNTFQDEAKKAFRVILNKNKITMLGDKKPTKYKSIVVSNSHHRTALLGLGKEINQYIANKIKKAKEGDIIRLNYYIIEHEPHVVYFYNAIKNALINGAKVEIITEGKNMSKEALENGEISKSRYTNQKRFFSGLLNTDTPQENTFNFYKIDRAGDSNYKKAINHRKVALLDIGGKKEIIISTANILKSGDARWQAAIGLDGNHYDSQWKWWNDVLDTDKCFAKGKGTACRLGNGGYQSNYQGWTSSYIVDKTDRDIMVEWLKKMKYAKGCSLRMLMGHLDSTKVLNEMKRIAEDGCKVDLIYAKEYIDGTPEEKYKKGNFEIEKQIKVHAKMILWQGNWGNSGLRQYAWVGSFNATNKAAHENDETMIRIKGEKLFKAFWNYFQWVEYDD